MADELNRYKEDNRIRQIVEEVIGALIKQCDNVCSQFKKTNARVDSSERQMGELNVFLRRVSLLQGSFEQLWEQVQDIELHKDMAEARRGEDVKEVRMRIDRASAEKRNESEILKGSIRKLNTAIEQCKTEMRDVVMYEEDNSRRVLALEANLAELKDSSKESVEAVRLKVEGIPFKFEQNAAEHKKMQLELEMLGRVVKGSGAANGRC